MSDVPLGSGNVRLVGGPDRYQSEGELRDPSGRVVAFEVEADIDETGTHVEAPMLRVSAGSANLAGALRGMTLRPDGGLELGVLELRSPTELVRLSGHYNTRREDEVILEGEGRMFATRGSDRCAVETLERLPLAAEGGRYERVHVRGYCTEPAADLGGDARLLVVKPWDRNMVGPIEKAINAQNLGLNPQSDGTVIRLAIPPLTEERRKDFVKMVKGRAEDGRTAVRSARRDARKDLDGLERDGDITEDEQRRAEDELDRLTKRHEAEIDAALDQKTVELMEA